MSVEVVESPFSKLSKGPHAYMFITALIEIITEERIAKERQIRNSTDPIEAASRMDLTAYAIFERLIDPGDVHTTDHRVLAAERLAESKKRQAI